MARRDVWRSASTHLLAHVNSGAGSRELGPLGFLLLESTGAVLLPISHRSLTVWRLRKGLRPPTLACSAGTKRPQQTRGSRGGLQQLSSRSRSEPPLPQRARAPRSRGGSSPPGRSLPLRSKRLDPDKRRSTP